MWHIVLLIAAMALLSCSTVSPTEVIGPYATSFSAEDLKEVRRRVSERSDLPPCIHYIQVIRPDYVLIQSGDSWMSSANIAFHARKRGKKWYIDPNTPVIERVIATS